MGRCSIVGSICFVVAANGSRTFGVAASVSENLVDGRRG